VQTFENEGNLDLLDNQREGLAQRSREPECVADQRDQFGEDHALGVGLKMQAAVPRMGPDQPGSQEAMKFTVRRAVATARQLGQLANMETAIRLAEQESEHASAGQREQHVGGSRRRRTLILLELGKRRVVIAKALR